MIEKYEKTKKFARELEDVFECHEVAQKRFLPVFLASK